MQGQSHRGATVFPAKGNGGFHIAYARYFRFCDEPFRRRERAMLRFRRMQTLQKFVSVHGTVYNHFNLERHLTNRQTYTNGDSV